MLSKFSDWITESGMTKKHIAFKLGVCPQYLWRIIRGYNVPSEELALEIEYLTGGAVTMADVRTPKKIKPRCPTCGRKIKHEDEK